MTAGLTLCDVYLLIHCGTAVWIQNNQHYSISYLIYNFKTELKKLILD